MQANNNTGGDQILSTLAGANTFDACILTFDFVPIGNSVSFNYVFASEEYPVYACGQYNDVFAFLVSGPNPAGGNFSNENIALIPGTNDPVAISSISNVAPCVQNAQYYVSNYTGTAVRYNAFTTILTAQVDVVPCATYTIKLAIADAVDGLFDSGVFLESGSFNVSILCQDVTVDLDPNGNASILASALYSSENIECSSPENFSATQTTFDCTDVGPNIVTLTATYPGGLSASCNATVTVQGADADEDGVPDVCDPCPLVQDEGNITEGFDSENCGCLPGYYQSTVTINGQEVITGCTICPSGSYCPDGVEAVFCPAGKYQSEAGATLCLNCEVGTFNPIPGATECIACDPGFISNTEGAVQCTACTPGTYNPYSGAIECQFCPTGTSTNNFGSSYCETCEPGTQAPLQGMALCETCVAPSFSACPTVPVVNNTPGQCDGVVTLLAPTLDGLCTRNHALDFDGDDDRVDLPFILNPANTNFTVEAWVKRSSLPAPGESMTIVQQTGTTGRSFLSIGELGRFYTFLGNSGMVGTTTSAANTWYHVAVTYDGTTLRLFVNGAEEASEVRTLESANGTFLLGIWKDLTIFQLDGAIDEVRFWNQARSAAEIQGTMNVEINSTYSGLLAYYNFNEGIAECNNAGLTTLTGGMGNNGTLHNFALSSDESNWVAGASALGDPLLLTNDISGDCSAFTGTYSVGNTTVTWTATGANGQTATCQQTITVNDAEAPQANCQNITVDLQSTGTYDLTAADINNSSSDNCQSSLTLSIPATSFDCDDVGNTLPVQLTVSDGVSSTTCTAQITVADPNLYCNQAPSAVCQNLTVSANSSCQGVAVASDFNDGSTDPDLDPLTFSVSPAGPYALGTTNVTLTVSDGNGGSDQCTATITVQDNTPPTILCPANITVNAGQGLCGAVVNYAMPSGSDNCTGTTTSQTLGLASGATFPVGTTTNTFEAIDAANLSTSCSFLVTVIDNIVPTASCQNVTVQLDATGNGSTTAVAVNNSSSDACGIAGLSLSPTAFTCANVGSNTVTLTVTDNNGNASTCEATVTVEDNVDPVALCQNVTVQLDASGNGSISTGDINNGSNDACGIANLSLDLTTFDCNNVGPVSLVTLTVTDVNGNSDECQAWVSVEDNIAPTAICKNITVQLDNTGSVYIPSNTVDDGSSDACGIQWEQSALGFFCSDVGANPVTLTVTDNNSNTSTCNAIITVEDNVAPIASCQNVIVQLDATGNGSTTAAAVNNNSSDACGIANLALSQTAFDCSHAGANSVTLTVTDNNGNTSSCTATVTVQDNQLPTITCPGNIASANDAGLCSAVVNFTAPVGGDNCSGTSTSQTSGQASGTAFPVGSTTNTFVVTDAFGNSASCSFTITVNDTEAPVISCPADISVNNDAGQCGAVVSYAAPSFSDNCSLFPASLSGFTLLGDYNGSRYFVSNTSALSINARNAAVALGGHLATITSQGENDFLKNATSGTKWIGYSDRIIEGAFVWETGETLGYANWWGGEPNNQGGEDFTEINFGAQGFWNDEKNTSLRPWIIEFDGLGVLEPSLGKGSGSFFPVGTTTLTYQATDLHGNTASCSFDVTVTDNEAPTITCPANVLVDTDAGACEATGVVLGAPATNDNCGVATTLHNGSTSYNVGTTTVTWTVTDIHGNPASCTHTVTVTDNEAPSAFCQNVTVYLDASGNGSTSAGAVDNSSWDACGIANLALSATDFTCANVGVNKVVLTVTDNNSNTASCNADVTVIDNIAPVALCQAVTVQLDATGNGSTTAAAVDAGSNDACGIASLNLSQTAFTCAHVGANNVTLTVTDNNGNPSTCIAAVTVQDNVAPEALCQNVTIQLNASGTGSTTAGIVNNNSNDACGIATLVLSQTAFDCSHVGINPVVLTVTDVNGNTASCNATVTVEDNIAPTALCKNYTVPIGQDGTVFIFPANVDNGSNDACGIGGLSVSPALFTSANVGPNSVTLTVTDVNGNTAICNATVTITKRPTTLTYSGDLDEQYSDQTDLSATLVDDLSGNGIEGRTVNFTIGSQSVSAVTNASGVANATLILTQDPAPSYTVSASFSEDDVYLGSSDSDAFDILQEDAIATYTGTLFASTSGNNNEATLTLIAAIEDPDDGFNGDISNAKVQFYDAQSNQPIGPVLDVILFDPNDPTAGYVQYDYVVNLNNNQESETYEIGIQVLHYYTRDYEADDALLTVSQPLNDFFTGGGYIFMEESAGVYAGDDGTKCHFSVNAKWTPNGNNPKGKVHFLVRRLEADGIVHTYRFKSNQIQSIGINPTTNEGEVAGKCNIQDVTDPTNPISLGGNKQFLVKVQDNGEPGTMDNIAITVYENGGSLLFSSYWNGTQSIYDLLDAGNLQVHYANGNGNGNQSMVIWPGAGPTILDEAPAAFEAQESIHVFPNPAYDVIQLQFTSDSDKNVKVEVVDQRGQVSLVRMTQVNAGINAIQLELQGIPPGTYWVRVSGPGTQIMKPFIRIAD
jgi:hypothetical protein